MGKGEMLDDFCKCDKMLRVTRRNNCGVIRQSVGLFSSWTVVAVVVVSLAVFFATELCEGADLNCANVKYNYEERGIGAVPKDALSGVKLRVCPKEQTCCTPEMETQLSAQSKQEYEKAVKDTLNKLAMVLKTRSTKFDEFFKALLAASKRDFHEMFKRTYGIIYEQNSFVFTEMFEELEKYYAKGKVDLGEAMDTFFNTLYLKIFTVMNGQYHIDDKYLGCVGEHMKELKPFGDVPQKLSVQLKRSFIATRTFSQALQVASDVVSKMQKITPSADCVRALTKMTGCPHCQGLPEVKACSNYCINVMKGCLAHHAELNPEWNNFVEQMDKISERLLGPFNIEMVVEPINIKISEAIMNFQENGAEISQRVFQGCGKPPLGRRRRALEMRLPESARHKDLEDDTESDENELHFADQVYKKYDRRANRPSLYSHVMSERHRRDAPAHRDSTSPRRDTTSPRRDTTELEFESLNFGRGETPVGPTLDALVKDIRGKTRDSKQFWGNLPYAICNDDQVAANPAVDTTCWNGAMKAKYDPQIIGDGMTNQQSNPEVSVDVNRPSSLLNEQVFALKTIVNKLKNAYQGMDVEWIDNEETSIYDGSGSGSGDGTEGNEVEGSGNGYDSVHSGSHPYQPTDHNTEDNNIRPTVPKDRSHNATTANSSDSSKEMSLTRAVSSYLLPIVVMWFGGIFSDWL